MNKKKNLLYLVMVLLLVVAVVGISYAMYTFTGTGTTENVITTGQISVSFAEQNNIKIENRYPETDTEGLANPDSNSSMTFTVSGNIVGDTTVNYAIGLVDIVEGATLTQDYIKIYLTKNGSVASGFTQNMGTTIKSFENLSVPNFLSSHAIAQGSVTGTNVDTYTLKAWIDEDYNLPITNTGSGNIHSNETTSETFSFKIKAVGTAGVLEIDSPALDNSGANAPVLASNMIPVYYDGNSWIKADKNNKDSSNKWYDYDDKMWANAVTVTSTNRQDYLDASAGTPILMEDINTMWVWIPRFSATGDTANYNGGTIVSPGAFNITFVDKEEVAHDAFTFGEQSLSGFWMGKFETTGSVASSCTNETCDISSVTVLPNSISLTNQTASSFFYMSKSMEQSGNPYGFDKTVDITIDTHMLKNNEWAAVAYLTQSIYGRCTSLTSCSEVEINDFGPSNIAEPGEPVSNFTNYNINFLATSLDCDNSKYISGGCGYDENVNQSTTGNIYGVYDMSGGTFDMVMGIYKPSTFSGITDYSGFSSSTSNSQYDKLPNSKYYNAYATQSDYTNAGLQHALVETSRWYEDYGDFVLKTNPWIFRGGSNSAGINSGIFSYSYSIAPANSGDEIGSRFAIIK